jgi:bifunctional DNA-binding transcriptional regulator/antitoxin component of YhaV-PrlF toxin-antitoxin module
VKSTKICRIRNESNALRTTLPKELCEYFGLRAGSSVTWIFDPCNKDLKASVIPSRRNDGGGEGDF